ncbi:MAG: transposase [Clostridiales bacterium]|nr:transposase [Clostridiales bacterium]
MRWRLCNQHCQEDEKRNLLEHLPKSKRARIKGKLNEAWGQADADAARNALESLARRLQVEHSGGAAILREGLEETLTVIALGVAEAMKIGLRSSDAMQRILRDATRKLKPWQNERQGSGLLEAERRFRRVRGYRYLPQWAAALHRRLIAGEEGAGDTKGSVNWSKRPSRKFYESGDNARYPAAGVWSGAYL